jgi:hypothetical protein
MTLVAITNEPLGVTDVAAVVVAPPAGRLRGRRLT